MLCLVLPAARSDRNPPARLIMNIRVRPATRPLAVCDPREIPILACAAGHSVCPFPPVSFPLPVDGAIGMFDSWLVEEGAVVRMLDRRRFPAPWFVEETPACFIVRDRAGEALAHLYYEESDGRSAANLLTKDQARRSATDIAKVL